jgi:hypothetical protein
MMNNNLTKSKQQSVKYNLIQTNSINNFQPDLLSKNFQQQSNTSRPSSTGLKGPVKLQTEYDKKPMTPDSNTISPLK